MRSRGSEPLTRRFAPPSPDGRGTADLRFLVDRAVLHHESDSLHRRDVIEWISRNRNDVSLLSRLDRPDLIGHAEELGGDFGGRLDRLHRRHSELRLVLEFLRLVDGVPCEAAGVRAERDLHAFAQSALETVAMK